MGSTARLAADMPTDSIPTITGRVPTGDVPMIDLRDPSLYINREASWLAFNRRVLEEAADERNPLIERVRFLAIFSSNLDEYYMTRVAELHEQAASGVVGEAGRDGLSPREQLALIERTVRCDAAQQRQILTDIVIPDLAAAGIHLLDHERLPGAARAELRDYFEREIYPLLTPLAIDAARPFPHISGLNLNLLIALRGGGQWRARIKVPPVLPRLLPVPPPGDDARPSELPPALAFTWIEQVITANIGMLFPGKEIVGVYPFRVTRNADLALREEEAGDLLETVEQGLDRRLFGFVTRLSATASMPPDLRDWLAGQLEISPAMTQVSTGPLGLRDLAALGKIARADLQFPPSVPRLPRDWPRGRGDVLDFIRGGDVLLHHPYDAFAPVVDLVRRANAADVLAIKQTLYRVGVNSPIVEALLEVRDDRTQAAALVELKARFDEENNIGWARALEGAGVHVAYGLVGLKTHCKLTLLVRRERDGLRRYAHLGTGNYNAQTAGVYTDFGLLTSDPDICADIADLFNVLTGHAERRTYRKLLVAPANLRQRLIELIGREATHGERGRLIFKANALTDAGMVEALYRASRAGVRIDLIVRGACILRPGVPGVSETIRVTSIVGRFLEHSRVYYFGNGDTGADELYLGSADLMPRNLDRRVEVLFPLEAPALKARVRDEILPLLLRDNVKARVLQPDGTYVRRHPAPGEATLDSQAALLAGGGAIEEGA